MSRLVPAVVKPTAQMMEAQMVDDLPEIAAGLAEQIRCHRCGRVLAISVQEGLKMILKHGGLHVYDAQILCSDCNVWRPWHSRRSSPVQSVLE